MELDEELEARRTARRAAAAARIIEVKETNLRGFRR
jgi:hypothetical protein